MILFLHNLEEIKHQAKKHQQVQTTKKIITDGDYKMSSFIVTDQISTEIQSKVWKKTKEALKNRNTLKQ